jgi:hypothetical protein
VGVNDPTVPTGDRDRRRGLVYPSPFFDVAQSYMPPTVKELFKWCKFFFYTDPMIGSVVTKLAEYPVTDFIYNTNNRHIKDRWKRLLEDTLALKAFLIEIGLDYFSYGNAFVSINLPFKRFLVCTQCKHQHPIDDNKVEWKFSNWKFQYECPKCKNTGESEIKDVPLYNEHDINLIRWDPANIEVDFNPLTGRTKYRYKIPNKTRRDILQGRKDLMAEIPYIFVQAIKEKKDIVLSEQNLFHFKRPTLAEQDQGWGKPIILHSMKRLFYLHVLRRAQEAIALQRILPLEFIFPQANGQQDPYQHVNLSTWSNKVEDELAKWRVDPNYISIIPVPIGLERLGGDGRALLLGPEIEVANKEITGGMGVPLEFVFGGLSWSGSSVSLRTLENHFLMYRKLLLKFVNWIKSRMRIILQLPDIELGFTEFKMADDVQRKQLVIQLNAAQKISDRTMLTELGFDADVENEQILKETAIRNRVQAIIMKGQAEASGEAGVVQAKQTAKAQEVSFKAQQQWRDQAIAETGIDPMTGAAPMPAGDPAAAGAQGAQSQQAAELDANAQRAAMTGGAGAVQAQQPGQSQEQTPQVAGGGGKVLQLDPDKQAQRTANKLAKYPPAEQQQVLAELQQQMPNFARLVMQYLRTIAPGGTVGQAKKQNQPAPQHSPPRRQGGGAA